MTDTPSTVKTGWLLNRDFALLWSGQLISVIGDYLFYTTIELWIAQKIALGQNWAPLAVGGSLMALTLPGVVLGPLAGVFVDRWLRRLTMMRMDMVRGLLIALLALLATPLGATLSLALKLSLIYTVIVLAATCAQFFNPARLGLVNTLVTTEQRTRASSLLFMTTSLGVVLGPALAAPLFFAVGPVWALVGNALSFLVSFLAIRAIRQREQEELVAGGQQDTFWADFLAGLRYYMHNRILRTLLIVTSLTLVGSGAINALGIFFLTTNLHSSPQWYGLLSTATGIGILGGSVGAAWLVPKLGAVRAFWCMTIITGLLIVLYARQTEYDLALGLLVLIGLPSAALNVAIGPLLLQATPPQMIGRIFAIFAPATAGAALLATALAGWLASTVLHSLHVSVGVWAFGPYDTIYCLGGAIIVLSGLYAWTQLREVSEGAQAVDEEETDEKQIPAL